MKLLHLSFHKGCINDFNYICEKLNYDCETLSYDKELNSNKELPPLQEKDCQQYNITHDRAEKYWNIYKEYFNKFDCIITSDTAPLSRIFLQNGWSKKLIIWVCNRFDYAHGSNSGFPDKEYYQLINDVKNRENIDIIPNTQFEIFYCKHRGIDISKNKIIKPLGLTLNIGDTKTIIKDKNETFFIPQYHNETIMCNLSEILNKYEIKNFNSRHQGLNDLIEFKGIITIPYAWSTWALFEYISLNMVVFLPSPKFLLSFFNLNFWHQNRNYLKENLHLSEWYSNENKNFFIYFDSWEDLQNKVKHLDYDKKKRLAKEFGEKHKEKMLYRWEKSISIV
jgi:hypothetical protein